MEIRSSDEYKQINGEVDHERREKETIEQREVYTTEFTRGDIALCMALEKYFDARKTGWERVSKEYFHIKKMYDSWGHYHTDEWVTAETLSSYNIPQGHCSGRMLRMDSRKFYNDPKAFFNEIRRALPNTFMDEIDTSTLFGLGLVVEKDDEYYHQAQTRIRENADSFNVKAWASCVYQPFCIETFGQDNVLEKMFSKSNKFGDYLATYCAARYYDDSETMNRSLQKMIESGTLREWTGYLGDQKLYEIARRQIENLAKSFEDLETAAGFLISSAHSERNQALALIVRKMMELPDLTSQQWEKIKYFAKYIEVTDRFGEPMGVTHRYYDLAVAHIEKIK